MQASSPQSTDQRLMVSFLIAKEEFGVDILDVKEIIRPITITRVPNTPVFVEGVINLRGRIIPVVDLRKRFNLPVRKIGKKTRIVVVELNQTVVGFILDAVREVVRIDMSKIEPVPTLKHDIDKHYLKGVANIGERLIILLDLNEVLSTEELQALVSPEKHAA